MNKISQFIRDFQDRREKKRIARIEATAAVFYQIKEYKHQLWFTFNGELFAPCKMMGCETDDDACVAIETLRKMYVERETE